MVQTDCTYLRSEWCSVWIERKKMQDGEFSTLSAKQNVNSYVIFYCFVLRVLVVDFTS